MAKIIHLVDGTGLVVDAAVFDDAAAVSADGKSIAWKDAEGEAVAFEAPTGQTYTDLPGAVIGSRIVKGAVVPPAAPGAAPGSAPSSTVRAASAFTLMSALTDAQRTAYPNNDGWDQRLFTARDTPWPEDDAQIARMAKVLGTTPKAWFDAALNPPTA